MAKDTPPLPYDPMLTDMYDLKPSSILLRPWDYMAKPRPPVADPPKPPKPPQP